MSNVAYSYIRMSTANQLKGDSLRRQAELSRQYAAAHDLWLDETLDLQDLGVSAFNGDNAVSGALSRFITGMESGRVATGSYLLVESLDRLSRQRVGTAMSQFLSIVEGGVTVVTLSDGAVYRRGTLDTIPLIQSLLIMSRAHEESEIKSQRVAAAWDNKRAQIRQRKLTAQCPSWLTLDSCRTSFTVNPARAATVALIFQLASNGLGEYSISKKLNADRVPTFGAKPSWGDSYVEKILRNKAVIGEFQPHRRVEGKRVPWGDPVADYYPKIVDDKLFLRVQFDRRQRSSGAGGRRGANQTNLFTHIAKCGHCGGAMRLVNKGKLPKGGRYLRCANSIQAIGCTAASWRYEAFETAFLTFCTEVDLASILVAHETSRDANDLRNAKAASLERLNAAEMRREKIYALLDTTSDLHFLHAKLEACHTEIEALKVQIEQTSVATIMARPSYASEAIKTLNAPESPRELQVRVRLATHLRDIIRSLRVSADGHMGKRLFDELDEYPQLNRVLDSDQCTLGLPAFAVEFADGMKRHVCVLPGDGSKYVRLLELPPEPGPKVTWAATD